MWPDHRRQAFTQGRAAASVASKTPLARLPEREEQPSGELRLTALSDLGTWVLPELLVGFALRYPQIQL